MPAAKILLDKWMKACSIASQTEAAHLLGKAGSATISNWRSGYAKPDDESIARMAEESGEDPVHWIGAIHLDFEKSDRLKKVWLRMAQAAAAVALMVTFGRLNGDHHFALAMVSFAHNPGTLSIMLTVALTSFWMARSMLRGSPRNEWSYHHALRLDV